MTWLERLIIGPILPLALGRNRFNDLALSAEILVIRRLSRFIIMLFSALAAADATTFATVFAQGDGNTLSVSSADCTRCPLTRSKMGLSLFWEVPKDLATALTGGILLPHPAGTFRFRNVTAVSPRRRELTQPVSNHVLRQVYRYMAPAIMYSNGQSDHVWHNHRRT